jgi:predicted Fe-Mo cluster-binding NifX family protein
MKIAIVSDDQKTINPHFGHARGFLILTVEHGQVIAREMRPRQSGCAGHEHEDDDAAGHAGQHCGAFVEQIADCEVVLAGRMGGGPYRQLLFAGIRPVFTEVTNIDEAVASWLAGTLTEGQPQLCH